MASLYSILGLNKDASPLDIRAAFKRQALCSHPDKGGSKESFQQVLFAFETLSNPLARARYDKLNVAKATPRQATARTDDMTTDERKAAEAGYSGKDQGQSKHGNKAQHRPCQPPAHSSAKHAQSPCQAECKTPTGSRSHFSHADAAENSAREQKAAQESASTEQDVVDKMWALLRRLPSTVRKQVLMQRFTEEQRRALESWMSKSSGSRGDRTQPQSQESVHATKALPQATRDFSQDRSDESTESDAASCDDVFMLCDIAGKDDINDENHVSPFVFAASNLGNQCESEEPTSGIESVKVSSGTSEMGKDDFVIPVEHVACGLDTASEPSANGREAACGDRLNVRQTSRRQGNIAYYRVGFAHLGLEFRSRSTSDVAAVLDILVVLSALKQVIVAHTGFADDMDLQQVVSSVLAEYGTTPEGMGLHYVVIVFVKWFWFPHRALYAPVTYDAGSASRAWQHLQRFQPTAMQLTIPERNRRVQSFHAEWAEFVDVFLSIVERHEARRVRKGSHEMWIQRLQAIKSKAETPRECAAMAIEERAGRCQRAALRSERRLERRNRLAFAREDRRSKTARGKLLEERLVANICKLLSRWWRARERQRRYCERQRDMKRRAVEQAERDRAKAARAATERRCQWLNRRDVTMADLLDNRSRPPEG